MLFIQLLRKVIIMPTKIDFIGGNTKRCLMAMALPMIAAMFLNMMYNLVDSLWIGNLLGETAYAALTNSTPIILILTSVAMGATTASRSIPICGTSAWIGPLCSCGRSPRPAWRRSPGGWAMTAPANSPPCSGRPKGRPRWNTGGKAGKCSRPNGTEPARRSGQNGKTLLKSL